MNTDTKLKNRLRELRERNNITPKEFAEKYAIDVTTLRSYENGNRQIPIDIAFKIATDYSVTLDWLYGRNGFLDEDDIMVNIIPALGKILKLHTERHVYRHDGQTYDNSEVVLLLDSRFREYLCDIQNIIDKRNFTGNPISDAAYKFMREEIHLKYKDYLKKVFGTESFNKEKSLKIESVKGLDLLDYLA